mmetsp:Transcript_122169/g.211972  ORF Transcript_122169/g.211972 Transcript_122169/m.211972 type:complete len:226 (+) Transcript_122169:1056-1733(+)
MTSSSSSADDSSSKSSTASASPSNRGKHLPDLSPALLRTSLAPGLNPRAVPMSPAVGLDPAALTGVPAAPVLFRLPVERPVGVLLLLALCRPDGKSSLRTSPRWETAGPLTAKCSCRTGFCSWRSASENVDAPASDLAEPGSVVACRPPWSAGASRPLSSTSAVSRGSADGSAWSAACSSASLGPPAPDMHSGSSGPGAESGSSWPELPVEATSVLRGSGWRRSS